MKKKKKAAPKKSKKTPKKAVKTASVLRLTNFKSTDAERAVMKRNALKYTGGNVGALIRMTAADPNLKLKKAA